MGSFEFAGTLSSLILVATLLLFVSQLQNRLSFMYVARQLNATRGYLMSMDVAGFNNNRLYDSFDFPALEPFSVHNVHTRWFHTDFGAICRRMRLWRRTCTWARGLSRSWHRDRHSRPRCRISGLNLPTFFRAGSQSADKSSTAGMLPHRRMKPKQGSVSAE